MKIERLHFSSDRKIVILLHLVGILCTRKTTKNKLNIEKYAKEEVTNVCKEIQFL